MNPLTRIVARLLPQPLPVLKPMPPHVRDLVLDPGALALHLSGTDRPAIGTVATANMRSGEAK